MKVTYNTATQGDMLSQPVFPRKPVEVAVKEEGLITLRVPKGLRGEGAKRIFSQEDFDRAGYIVVY